MLSKIRMWCEPTLKDSTLVGVGDDAAVVGNSGDPTILCSDLTIEGTHFDLSFSTPMDVGFKCLARALSDIAAMGGRSVGVTVSIALPKNWAVDRCLIFLEDFFRGAVDIALKTETTILGGDLSSIDGPIVIDVAALGATRKGTKPWLRSGAKPGDLAFVTGPLGAAGFALRELIAGRGTTLKSELALRHLRPWPRLDIAKELATSPIHAAMDLSDGLFKDGPRLARESKVSFHIDETKIPLALRGISDLSERERLDFAINSGDDYELLLAIPKEWATSHEGSQKIASLGLVHIGHFS